MPDLDGFLTEVVTDPEPAPEPEPVAVEAPPTEVAKGVEGAPPARELPPRGEDGKWVKSEPLAAPTQQSHMVPLEALLAEREKRQEAERKAAEVKPKVDFWENPEEAMRVTLEAEREKLREEARGLATSEARSLFLQFTESEARGRYTDYDQMREVFAESAAKNPMLADQLRNAPNPAEFIYQQGKSQAELKAVGGNLADYRKRLEAELRQKLEAEYAAKATRTASVPQSLNSEPSKGAGITGAVWNGPTPIEDILPNRRD